MNSPGSVEVYEVSSGSLVLTRSCPVCGLRFIVGDRVVQWIEPAQTADRGVAVRLVHATCEEGQSDG